MDINNYCKVSGLILVIIVVLLIIYISIKKDDFGSMEKLLQGNTDIELIRNTDEPTKKTSIIVNSDDFFSKTMTKGELGVAESYMDGDWDTPDLERTLSNIMSNQDKLEKHICSLEFLLLGLNNYITTYLPNNTLHSVKDNIEHHYDIGNDLYSKMLGKHMQYTCSYFYKEKARPQSLNKQKQLF